MALYYLGLLASQAQGMGDKMNRDEHIKRHKELHERLDELVADFITHTQGLPSKTSLMDLMEWSFEQTKNPTGED